MGKQFRDLFVRNKLRTSIFPYLFGLRWPSTCSRRNVGELEICLLSKLHLRMMPGAAESKRKRQNLENPWYINENPEKIIKTPFYRRAVQNGCHHRILREKTSQGTNSHVWKRGFCTYHDEKTFLKKWWARLLKERVLKFERNNILQYHKPVGCT